MKTEPLRLQKVVNQVDPVAAATLPPVPAISAVKPNLPSKDVFGRELASTHFFAAKGETIGFSVMGKPIVKAPDLCVKLYSMPKFGGMHDPLVPGDDSKSEDTFIELHVPKNTPAGDLKGQTVETLLGSNMPLPEEFGAVRPESALSPRMR